MVPRSEPAVPQDPAALEEPAVPQGPAALEEPAVPDEPAQAPLRAPGKALIP
jgi:hypothetical protein